MSTKMRTIGALMAMREKEAKQNTFKEGRYMLKSLLKEGTC